MSTPEPFPYRKLNYPVNNLAQDFDATEKDQVRQNIGIPSSVNKAGKVLKVDDNTGNLAWADDSQGVGTVTDVKVNGSSVVSDGVAEVTVPTKTSDLQNDSGFLTSQAQADWLEQHQSDPSYIKNKPSIPSKTSDLQNDSGFITLADVPDPLPPSTSADEGKVLTVDSNGDPSWQQNQGGDAEKPVIRGATLTEKTVGDYFEFRLGFHDIRPDSPARSATSGGMSSVAGSPGIVVAANSFSEEPGTLTLEFVSSLGSGTGATTFAMIYDSSYTSADSYRWMAYQGSIAEPTWKVYSASENIGYLPSSLFIAYETKVYLNENRNGSFDSTLPVYIAIVPILSNVEEAPLTMTETGSPAVTSTLPVESINGAEAKIMTYPLSYDHSVANRDGSWSNVGSVLQYYIGAGLVGDNTGIASSLSWGAEYNSMAPDGVNINRDVVFSDSKLEDNIPEVRIIAPYYVTNYGTRTATVTPGINPTISSSLNCIWFDYSNTHARNFIEKFSTKPGNNYSGPSTKTITGPAPYDEPVRITVFQLDSNNNISFIAVSENITNELGTSRTLTLEKEYTVFGTDGTFVYSRNTYVAVCAITVASSLSGHNVSDLSAVMWDAWSSSPNIEESELRYFSFTDNTLVTVDIGKAMGGDSVTLAQGNGISLSQSNGVLTISGAELPTYSSSDSGKVLQVKADGTLAWVTLS